MIRCVKNAQIFIAKTYYLVVTADMKSIEILTQVLQTKLPFLKSDHRRRDVVLVLPLLV